MRSVYGVVQSFRRVSTSADETHYTLRLVPRIALMHHTRHSEIYLNQSVIEVVENVLREHELEGADFEFRLLREYPERELITQWRETDLEFVQRLLAEVGIFWRFEMDSRLGQDVVIFMDSPEQYQFGVTLPLRHPSGMSDSGQESVWDLRTAYQVVSGSVATRDYNYREALTPQDSTQSVSSTDGITTGEVYHYAEPFLTEGDPNSPETGAYYARLRHERLLNEQSLMTGRSTSLHLLPGQMLEVDGSVPEALTAGIVITHIRCRGSRRASFLLDFEGIPYSETVCFRPPLRRRPVISGTLPARVESTQKGDIYAWLDETGRYRVKLDVDRTGREQGYAYLWLRLAKPYAGDNYGWHAPLLDGTEVSVAFDSGDRETALKEIDLCLQQIAQLSASADAANALQADIASQSAMFSERLKPLNEMIHVSAPDGVAFTSGKHMQLTATKNVAVSAGGDISVGVMGNMTALAGEKLGLFAHSGPLSLKSGEGPLEVQAQNGGMQLAAEKKVTLTSVSDISFAGKKRITLIGGGSYLKLEAGKIEYGTPQVYLRKVERTFNASKAAATMSFHEIAGGGICVSCLMKAAMKGDSFVIRG
ncbi:type VI secretion system Vgr family protein [Cronobacter sakazakii]